MTSSGISELWLSSFQGKYKGNDGVPGKDLRSLNFDMTPPKPRTGKIVIARLREGELNRE